MCDICCICLEKQDCVKCNNCNDGLYCHGCLLLLIKNNHINICSICRQYDWIDKENANIDKQYNENLVLNNFIYNEGLIHINYDVDIVTRDEIALLTKYFVPIYIIIMVVSLYNGIIV